jgi:hypothetical protein
VRDECDARELLEAASKQSGYDIGGPVALAAHRLVYALTHLDRAVL